MGENVEGWGWRYIIDLSSDEVTWGLSWFDFDLCELLFAKKKKKTLTKKAILPG